MASYPISAKRRQLIAGLTIQLTVLMTLAIFRSDKLLSFSYDLPSNTINDRLVILAEDWNEKMDKAGITFIAPKFEELIAKLRGELGD